MFQKHFMDLVNFINTPQNDITSYFVLVISLNYYFPGFGYSKEIRKYHQD